MSITNQDQMESIGFNTAEIEKELASAVPNKYGIWELKVQGRRVNVHPDGWAVEILLYGPADKFKGLVQK